MIEYLYAIFNGVNVSELFPVKVFKEHFNQEFKDFKFSFKYANEQEVKELISILMTLSSLEGKYRSGSVVTQNDFKCYEVSNNLVLDVMRILSSIILNEDIYCLDYKYSPSFKSFLNKYIGNADGDWITIKDNGGCLVDFKTIKQARITKNMIFQLLGYVALDYENNYNLKEMGIMLTRQNYFLKYDIEKFIETYSKTGIKTISEFRNELGYFVVD